MQKLTNTGRRMMRVEIEDPVCCARCPVNYDGYECALGGGFFHQDPDGRELSPDESRERQERGKLPGCPLRPAEE